MVNTSNLSSKYTDVSQEFGKSGLVLFSPVLLIYTERNEGVNKYENREFNA